MRLVLDVLRAVRAEVGAEFPVWVKLDSREVGKDGGITVEDAQKSARMIEQAGADAITMTTYHDTSFGKLHSESHTPHIDAWNLPATAKIKEAVSIPVLGSGRVEPEVGDRAIGKGEIDFIAMGRKMLADPHLPNKLAAGAPEKVRPCIYCYTCISAIYMGDHVRCAVNPELAYEFEGKTASNDKQHVAVIGGGPGGMESARRLAALGHTGWAARCASPRWPTNPTNGCSTGCGRKWRKPASTCASPPKRRRHCCASWGWTR